MKPSKLILAALAVAFVATLWLNFGLGKDVNVKKQGEKSSERFVVPKGKDAAFYADLEHKLFQEFGEAGRSIQTQEEYGRLSKEFADALATVYLYTNNGTDEVSKGTCNLAFSEACNFYAAFDYLDELKELRKIAANNYYRNIADAEIIQVEIRKAIAEDDRNALEACVEEFFSKAKADAKEGRIGSRAFFIHDKLEKYDEGIAKAFSDRFVETFKEVAYKDVTERLVGRERFKSLVGKDVKVEGLLADGSEFDWDAYRGKVVLVEIWFPQSSEVVSNFRNTRALYEKYHDDGFEVVGYALHANVDELKRQEEDLDLPWKSISARLSTQAKENEEQKYVSLRDYYGLSRLEAKILVDKDGKAIVTDDMTGASRRSFEPYIKDALYGSVDDSIFDVPDGKDLAFYADLCEKINSAVERKVEKISSQKEEDQIAAQWRDALISIFKNAQDLPDSEKLCDNTLASLSRIALVGREVETAKKLLDLLSNNAYRKRLETLLADVQARVEGRERFENLVGNEMKVEGLYLDGTEIDWDSYRGKVVLVDFWATWCDPCVAEFPHVLAQYEKYRDAGFEVIGYSIDKNVDALKEFQEKRNLPWKIASETLSVGAKENGGKEYVSLSDYYNITGIPTMILVGRDGKVVSTKARDPELGELLKKEFPDVQ